MSERIEKSEAVARYILIMYFALLLAEGILRKWVIPGLSGQILLMRDALAILALGVGVKERILPRSAVSAIVVVVISFLLWGVVQFLAGVQSSIWVLLYGTKTYVGHIPLILLAANLRSFALYERAICQMTLFSAPLMALLVLAQFASPKTAFINAAAGGHVEQLGYIDDLARASGSFTFILGLDAYCIWLFCVAIACLVGVSRPWKILAYNGLLCSVIIAGCSGSRAVLVQLLLVAGFASAIPIISRRHYTTFLVGALLVMAMIVSLFFTEIGTRAVTTMLTRVESAAAIEGGLVGFGERVGRGVLGWSEIVGQAGITGKGIGVGTNVGAYLLSGSPDFLLAEDEYTRIVLELGAVFGGLAVVFRILFTAFLGIRTVDRIRKNGPNAYLWMLSCLFPVFIGQLWQPSVSGFAIAGLGLVFGRLRAVQLRYPSNFKRW